MTGSLPDIVLDLDPTNPGQFLACCGLFELASRRWPGCQGWFGRDGDKVVFSAATGGGHNDPMGEIVGRLCDSAELVALAADHESYSEAGLKPVVIVPFTLRLDWWIGVQPGSDKSRLKVWAGQQTPERNINNLREAWRHIRTKQASADRGLLASTWPLTGRFGFDPSAAWEAIDVGFSPDEQGTPVMTSPATEILAAIGLQRCQPVPNRHKKGRWFAYRTWSEPIEIATAAAALAGAGRALGHYEFPVQMRNSQYGNFGWAKPVEAET